MLNIAFFSDLHNNQYYMNVVTDSIEALSEGMELDALALVGDIIYLDTNVLPSHESYSRLNANKLYTKMKNEGKLIFALGNHEFTLWMEGEEIKTLSRKTFTDETGLLPEMDTVIKGYHFITAGPADYAGTPSKEIEAFIKEKVTLALEESDKPVFLLVHFPIDNTLCGTEKAHSYTEEFREFIINEPRVIIISGHYHFPNSDPRTITQVEGGATFFHTSTIMGGNGLSLPTATERHAEYPTQGFMLRVDEETNDVTIKPFYASEKEPSYLENAEFVIKRGVYNYTDKRAEKSGKPYFAKGSTLRVDSVSDVDATVTFPAALPADAGMDSIVAYYDIELIDKTTGDSLKKHRIISDFFLKNKREDYTYTLFDLDPSTEYEVKVSPVTSWYVLGDSISTELKTAEPKFFDVPLDNENAIVKGIFESVITGSRTAYSNLIHIGSGWECSVEHTVDIKEAGTYRIFLKSSAKGAVDAAIRVKKDGAVILEDTVIINTGNIHVYKDIICADAEIKEAGGYNIEFSFKDGKNTVGIQGITVTKHI
ncbi:MAG: metallophosphoesterase [Clostridia bacterium]|nr:metallophosphoesterase [Clostridia bacterium]